MRYCVVGTEQTGALRGLDVVGGVALLADVGLDLAALAVGIAGLRTGLLEVRPVHVHVGAARQDLVVEGRVVGCR